MLCRRHCQLFRRTEYLLEGGAADSIICLVCGDRLASRPVLVLMSRPFDNYVDHIAGRGKSDAYTDSVPCITPGCTHRLNDRRSSRGQTHCSWCAQKINRKAFSQRLKEKNHVETNQSLPCLAPPAPPAPAIGHPQSRVVDDRRDGDESLNFHAADWENAPSPAALSARLFAAGLPVSAAVIICYWNPDERTEVNEFLSALEKITGKPDLRKIPPMPDVLCTIYDALQATG